ncbi:MAG: rhomboid family intramembrane serine protease [Deltaproteobacteria bacterium]|nr:rhomboid family intramembrane serine protease [Deltaproteobacteria bacterium]
MLLPIGHDESEVRRLPWVTFTLMALCLLTLFGTGTSSCDGSLPEWEAQVEALIEAQSDADEELAIVLPPTPYDEWGLVPANVRLSRMFTHQFMHAGWLHLAGNMLLLFLLGPPLEDRWGRPVFLGLYLTAGIFAGLFFTSMSSPESTMPLVGASGAIAGVMGAYLVRLFKSRLRYFYFLFYRMGTFEAPAYLMLPLWFGTELFNANIAGSMGQEGGVAYWAHVGGFLWGMAFAGILRFGKIEAQFLSSRLEAKLTLAEGNPIIEEVQALREDGRFEEAYEKLRRALRQNPGDPDVVIATWDAAAALQRPEEAATALTKQIERWTSLGELQAATDYWCELTLLVPDAEVDPRILLKVAQRLDEQDRPLESRRALEHAVGRGAEDLPPGLALRFYEVARHRAPELAADVARRALAWHELPDGRRKDIETDLRELDRVRERADAPDPEARSEGWQGEDDRAMDLHEPTEPDEPIELELGSVSEPLRSEPAPLPGLDEMESGAVPTPPSASDLGSGPRWRDAKIVEGKPSLLDGEGLSLRRGNREHRILFSRIQAIAAGAVHGLGERPVLLIDLAMNWNDPDAETLQVVRLRSDQFDPCSLVHGESEALPSFRLLVTTLLEASGATPLPDLEAARGIPSFSTFPDTALYASVVLDIEDA